MEKEIKINGINHTVIEINTTDEIKERWPNTARVLEKNGWVAEYTVKRPRGKKIGTCYLHKTGVFGKILYG